MENVTDTQSVSFASGLVTFVYPIIAAFGLVGNILSFIAVANRHCKQSSFSVYIAALSLADTFSLITFSLHAWPNYALGVNVPDSGPALCKLIVFLSYFSGAISTWLVAVMSFERLIVTYFPSRATRLFAPKTGVIMVIVIVSVHTGLYGHLLYGHDVKMLHDVTICGFTEENYEIFYLFYFLWIDFAAYFCLPFLTIILCNAAVLTKISVTIRRVHPGVVNTQAAGNTPGQAVGSQNRQILKSVMLISTSFLICCSPYVLYLTIRPYIVGLDVYFPVPNSTDELLSCVFGALMLVYYSLNFYIYVLTGKRFRENLKKVFYQTFRLGNG